MSSWKFDLRGALVMGYQLDGGVAILAFDDGKANAMAHAFMDSIENIEASIRPETIA